MKLDKDKRLQGDALNRKVDQQASQVPTDPSSDGPKRRTWEGYADDYRALSEELVDMSRQRQEAQSQIEALEQQLTSKESELKRVKAQRQKDLDRLAAVSRTRDLLEKRAAAQMAKVAAALARPAPPAMAPPAFQPAIKQADRQGSTAPIPNLPAPNEAGTFAARLEERPARSLGLFDRTWWQRTIRAGRTAHKEQRLGDAQLFFEVALLVNQTASLWKQLGDVLREAGQFSDAEIAYRRALRTEPGNGLILFLSGYCLEMAGDANGAIPLYEAALAADPQLANRYDHLRHFRERLGR